MDYKVTHEEKKETLSAASEAIIAYMGGQKEQNSIIAKGINYLKWMLAILLCLFATFLISIFWNRYTDDSFRGREKQLTNREKLFTERIRILATKDSLAALDLKQRRDDIIKQQTILFKRDSILKLTQAQTINTNTVNTKNLNIKK